MPIRVFFNLLKRAAIAWNEDNAPAMGAAIAYYTTLSLAPLLLIAINIATMFVGADAARNAFVHEVHQTLGATAGAALTAMLDNAYQTTDGTASMTFVGLLLLGVGAYGVFAQLQDSLNVIWKTAAPPRTHNIIVHFLIYRLFSFAAVLGTGIVLLASLIVTSMLAEFSHWLKSYSGSTIPWHVLVLFVSFCSITLMFALIFKLLPNAPIAWGDVWIGALITGGLWLVGQHLIAIYLSQASPASAYGAAGSLVVVLVWVYYSAQIVLFGAELAHTYAMWRGSELPASVVIPGADRTVPDGDRIDLVVHRQIRIG